MIKYEINIKSTTSIIAIRRGGKLGFNNLTTSLLQVSLPSPSRRSNLYMCEGFHWPHAKRFCFCNMSSLSG